jgi:hypothetical protein
VRTFLLSVLLSNYRLCAEIHWTASRASISYA